MALAQMPSSTEMAANGVDYTLCFRRLGEVAAGRDEAHVAELFKEPARLLDWAKAWRKRLEEDGATSPAERAALMLRANPAFIPRNHRVEEMIDAADGGRHGRPSSASAASSRAPTTTSRPTPSSWRPPAKSSGPTALFAAPDRRPELAAFPHLRPA
jgi:uncharacterized protein YdiU (UPF0061 family)